MMWSAPGGAEGGRKARSRGAKTATVDAAKKRAGCWNHSSWAGIGVCPWGGAKKANQKDLKGTTGDEDFGS